VCRAPSPIRVRGHTFVPSPTRGEGTIMLTELAARRRTVRGHFQLTMSNSPDLLVPAARFCARGFATLLRSPESRGGRSAERRSGAAAPVGRIMTRYARRLRGALRPMTRDARLSALHRGGFGLPGPRFRLLGRPPSYNGGQLPCGSVQRAPRTQVVVPGGRGPCLPGRTVTSRRRRTPRLAPHSGSSLEHALNERGCVWSSIGTLRSQ
jgi:hypothetical protein